MNVYAIHHRNERTNGEKTQESLHFMEYVKLAPTEELVHQRHYAVDWQRVAIDRELGRREKR